MDQTTPTTMLDDREVIRLSGDDVRGFMQGLVTNDTTTLAPDRPLWTGLLNPQGKALFDFLLWTDGADILVDCEAEQSEAIMRRLAMYRLRRRIAITLDGQRVHWSATGTAGIVDPRLPVLGRRWLGPMAAAAVGWRAHRLSLGVCEGVGELGWGGTLWLECNARELNGVSFGKGCYVGQENTARMHHRSKVNRRLIVVPIAEPGDRTRAVYSDLGVMVEHRRVEDIPDALVPEWLRAAPSQPQ